MTAKSKSTKKGGTKGKAEGSKGRLTSAAEERIRREIEERGKVTHALAGEAYIDAYKLYLENPEELAIAQRCVEIYKAEIEKWRAGDGREYPHGAYYLVERVDEVMADSSDNLMVESPEAELFVYLFVRAAREWIKGLDRETHFNTVAFIATLYLKIREIPATERQALFSDPTFAQALYPHVKLAFPEQVKEAFGIYFRDLAERVPHVLDEIQQKAEEQGGGS